MKSTCPSEVAFHAVRPYPSRSGLQSATLAEHPVKEWVSLIAPPTAGAASVATDRKGGNPACRNRRSRARIMAAKLIGDGAVQRSWR